MQRFLAMLLVPLLALTVACGDDNGDDSADAPTTTLTSGTGGAGAGTTRTVGGITATTGPGGATATIGGAMTATTGGGGGGTGDAATGQQLAASNGCTGCHSIDGSTLVGPTWKGLYGEEVELDGGDTVTADDAYITESIKNPSAKIVAGFSNVMPPFNLDDTQIADIIAYMKTLK